MTNRLYVPHIALDADLISAALAYAKAGWFVLPINPSTKMPALGRGWPTMTSNDTETIVGWFAGTDYQLGLHVGRSGAVALDVDDPSLLHPTMKAALKQGVPFQSTRSNEPDRGHWIFTQPPGRTLGNSRGAFNDAKWGEVRGQNGIIVVAPSTHPKPEGRYAWITVGEAPDLPGEIADALPDLVDDGGEAVASNAQVKAFIDEHDQADRPSLLTAIGNAFAKGLQTGSRHEALVDALCWAMREARMGLFPAQSAVDMLLPDFEAALRGETGRSPLAEFQGVLAFAVARAKAIDPAKREGEVQARIAPTTRIPSVVRKESAVMMQARVLPDRPQPRSARDYIDPREGLDAQLLAQDVMQMGELAYGLDNQFWSYEHGVWLSRPEVVEARTVWLLQRYFRGSHAKNTETVVKHSISTVTCDPTPNYINFTNGMLDWRSNEMIDHAPHFGSTVQLPVDYEPSAECPVFEKYLDQTLSPAYKEFMWEMIGYLMMSGNPLQVAFMLIGKGSNGKGTVMRVINDLLGRENCSAVTLDSLTQDKFAPARLFGKLANIAGDIDATFQENTAKFKSLTGEDPFSGENKYAKSFDFQCWAVPVFSANKPPGSSDLTNGYLRRWKVIEFVNTITEKDAIPGLSDTLSRELPGIAAKGILSLQRLMARNGGRGGFIEDPEITAGKERFSEAIDQVRQWLADATLPMPEHREKLPVAYREYRQWAINNGNKPVKASEFQSRLDGMSEAGISVSRIRGTNYVRGIGLVQDRDQTYGHCSEESPV